MTKEAMKADDQAPDYRKAMLYHSDRADALMAERDDAMALFHASDKQRQALQAERDALKARAEAAEAKLATCEKYRDAYAECDRIGTEAVRELEAKVAQLESLTRGQDEQLEIQGNTIIRINGRAEAQSARVAELEVVTIGIDWGRDDAAKAAVDHHFPIRGEIDKLSEERKAHLNALAAAENRIRALPVPSPADLVERVRGEP